MWLSLTTVKFIKVAKKEISQVVKSRINMDLIESYSEAPDDVKNHASEDARANTLMYIPGGNNFVYHVKETVEEIDDMIAAYGSENVELTPSVPLNIEIVQKKLNEAGKIRNPTSEWDNSDWK